MSDTSRESAGLALQKKLLRGRVRAARRSTTEEQRTQRDEQLIDHLLHHLRRVNARTVAAYFPMTGEPGGQCLVTSLSAAGLRVLLPRVVHKPDATAANLSGTAAQELQFCDYNGQLETSSWGIPEPTGPEAKDFPDCVDAFLIPALAIGRDGRRLGQGGGFYDRTLESVDVSLNPVWAIVDAEEVVDSVPSDSWDIRVNGAITPDGLLEL